MKSKTYIKNIKCIREYLIKDKPNLTNSFFIIRKFRKKDANELSEMIQNTVIKCNSKDYTKKQIQTICSKHLPEILIEKSKKRIIYVAEDILKGKIIGTATLENDYVSSVFVDLDYQNIGIGLKLMDKIEKKAIEMNCKILKLHSTKTSLGFYKKLDFNVIKKTISEKYGENFFMEKKLD